MLNKSEYTWTIDPIDGTASYIAGVPLYSTLISLLLNGRPIFGLSLFPALFECVFALSRLECYRLTVEGCGVLEFNRDNGIRNFLWSSSCLKKIPSRLRKNLNLWCRYERTFPDAYGHLLVIRGKINIMVDPYPLLQIWDISPLIVMLNESCTPYILYSQNGRYGLVSTNESTTLERINRFIKKQFPAIRITSNICKIH